MKESASMEQKHFIVPPNMGEQFLIFGMTVPEIVIVVVLVFLFVKELMLGHPLFVILPIGAAVLFIRSMDNGNTNCLTILKMEFRYFLNQKNFSFGGGEVEYGDEDDSGD